MSRKRKFLLGRFIFIILLLVGTVWIFTGLINSNNGDKPNLGDNDNKGNGQIIIDNNENKGNSSDSTTGDDDKKGNDDKKAKEDIVINMAAVGDIMFHPREIWGAHDEATDTFDFKPYFQYVKPILEKADIAVGNFEGTTCGDDLYEYQGYPLFNAPDDVLDALKDAGFDVLSTINNHTLDTRKTGVIRTIEKMDARGIAHVGTYKEKPESRVIVQDVNGIKIAFLAYTEMLNGMESVMTGEDLDNMVNWITYDQNGQIDYSKIKQDIADANAQQADLIVMFVHWGHEYWQKPNQMQLDMSDVLLELGVDVILGSHPHVLQEIGGVMYNGEKKFVAYSTGNFISNQRTEEELDPQTEDGVIVNLTIKKDGQTGKTTIEGVEYTPTWVYRESIGSKKFTYRILPVMDFIESNDFSDNIKARLRRSLEDTTSKLNTGFIE